MKMPKILIVDDEGEHQMAIMNVIAQHEQDYDILSAFDGQKALEIAQNERPDLIISDWEMPVMNGIDFIKKLKADEKTVDIPVIMCTGIMISSENLQTALQAGAVDYVRKPVDKIELIARIKANLHLAEKYSEVKKLNATLTDKYKEIKNLNEAKDKIFSVISHDLRGPVGTIKSFVDLILSEINDYSIDELEKVITMVSKQSGSVFTILDNLLLWANGQQKNIKFKPSKQFINNAVAENIALLDAGANNKGITLHNNVANNLTANFDYNLISTVLRNLINNAIKFTPKGGTVSVNVEKGEQFHTIIVSDTGVGISPEHIAKILDKTLCETTYGTNSEKGSGLGLKLCLEFVEVHKGKIWVESEIGIGSDFCFTLPAD